MLLAPQFLALSKKLSESLTHNQEERGSTRIGDWASLQVNLNLAYAKKQSNLLCNFRSMYVISRYSRQLFLTGVFVPRTKFQTSDESYVVWLHCKLTSNVLIPGQLSNLCCEFGSIQIICQHSTRIFLTGVFFVAHKISNFTRLVFPLVFWKAQNPFLAMITYHTQLAA